MAEFNRRTWIRLAGAALAGGCARAEAVSLFDGRTLDGWLQIENNATTLSSGGILDPAGFMAKLTAGTDVVSEFLGRQLPDGLKSELTSYAPANATAKTVMSALVKELNRVIAGPSIYDAARFGKVVMRAETAQLARGEPQGQNLMRLNKLLLEDAYPGELAKSATTGWVANDGAMASTGSGRGVIYTAKDYSRFRLTFTMRHVSGNPDHQGCVLIFCTRPKDGEKPLDALGGIQFQVPNGGHWDYRVGMNNAGGAEFTTLNKTRFDPHEWSRVEIVADAATGTARMAVAQPLESPPVEVLAFQDPAAGKRGPVAWQMHNAGLFDEYRNVAIEEA
ncbi:MAG TPA: DUF1080 domain-containing protein [Bryobacteraceae bacterium]|nr:DUF1080 domain-containing protein [Bryobacteraceae bacterium]